MVAAELDGSFGHGLVQGDGLKAVEELADAGFFAFVFGSYHDLNPGDDADPGLRVAL